MAAPTQHDIENMMAAPPQNDIENMVDYDVYVGDEQSRGSTDLTGPPDDIEPIHVHESSLKRTIMQNKLLFGVGVGAVLIASIPILLLGLNTVSVSHPHSRHSTGIALVNDVCVSAVKLVAGNAPTLASTSGASDDGDIEKCGIALSLGPSVWFKVVGTGGPVKVIKDDMVSFTNVMSVYSGTCGELTCLTGDNLKGSVLWNTELDKVYFIRVSGVNGATGNFHIAFSNLAEAITGDVAVNDLCEDSLGLPTDGSIYEATTETATFDIEGAGSCYRTSNAGAGVWYDVIGTGGSLIATTNSSTTMLAIFTDTCDKLECKTASDLAEGVDTYVQWDSELARRYYILAHGIGGETGGPFEISVSDSKADDAHFLINDFCKGAIGPVASDGSVIHGSTEFATEDKDGAGSCYPELLVGDGVWYSVQGVPGMMKVYPTHATEMEPLVSVFKGECRKLKCVDNTRHTIDDEERKVLSWEAEEDEMYYLLVRGYNNNKGSFQISVESVPDVEEDDDDDPSDRPINDYCESAVDIPLLNREVIGSTEGATTVLDGLGSCHFQQTGPGVWYRVVGSGKSLKVSATHSTEIDAFFSVYTGDCEEPVCVPDSFGEIGAQSTFTWDSTEQMAYYVLVQGRAKQEGSFSFVVEEAVAPNDLCTSALGPIPSNGTSWHGTTRFASPDLEGSDVCYSNNLDGIDDSFQGGAGVWYTVLGTGGTLQLLAKGESSFPLIVSAFGGYDCSTLSCIGSTYVEADSAGVLSLETAKNVHYYVLVNGVGDAVGDFELLVKSQHQSSSIAHPVEIDVIVDNGSCETASGPLSPLDTTLAASTVNSKKMQVSLPSDPSCSVSDGLGIWYTVEGSDTMIETSVQTFQDATELGIAIFSGPCDKLTCVKGIDKISVTASKQTVSWEAKGDKLYHLYVHSPPGATGPFELEIKQMEEQAGAPADAPANDVCATAFPVTRGATYEGSTDSARIDSTVSDTCEGNANIYPGVWHHLVGNGKTWTLLQNETFKDETGISIFSGTCDKLSCLESHSTPAAEREPISWTTKEGEEYFILVETRSSDPANFGFWLEESEPKTEAPAGQVTFYEINDNDRCENAIEMVGGAGIVGSFNFATQDEEAGSCVWAPNDNPGVWFTVNGTGNGMRITTCRGFTLGSEQPLQDTSYASVSVYREGCDSLECYAGSNNTCSDAGLIQWNTEVGELYHVLISGDDDAMQEGFDMLHDEIEWDPNHCLDVDHKMTKELQALYEFFNSTGNTKESGPLVDKGWLKGCDVCTNWKGLWCDPNPESSKDSKYADGTAAPVIPVVNRIHLGGQSPKLTGTFPKNLKNIKKLTVLDLADNDFEGPLTKDDVGKLKKLQSLNLRGNKFSGTLPEELGKLKDLVQFDLNNNSFEGPLPGDLEKMKSIELFSLGNNTFTGTIPTTFGLLSTLYTLRVQENKLNGKIPKELGLLTNLAYLELHSNDFTGTMPKEICALRTSGALNALSADCDGDEPKVSCPEDCCTQCY